MSVPALTVGKASIVMTTASLADGQGPFGSFVVNVSVIAFVDVPGSKLVVKLVASTKEPEVDVQSAEVAVEPIAPDNVANWPAQTEKSAPAFTVGGTFTLTVDTAVTVQPSEV